MSINIEENLFTIRRKAGNLLSAAGLNGLFPLELTKVTDFLNYTVFVFGPTPKSTNVSGSVSKKEATILLNDKESLSRKRFTLAHEIGHIILHFSQDDEFVDYNRSYPRDLKEVQADEFAACLLMPEEVFIREWNESKHDYTYLENYFGVSPAAVGMRAYRLGLE